MIRQTQTEELVYKFKAERLMILKTSFNFPLKGNWKAKRHEESEVWYIVRFINSQLASCTSQPIFSHKKMSSSFSAHQQTLSIEGHF